MTWFIDKLSMHQEYPEGGLKLIGKHGVLRYDLATGDRIADTVNSLPLEGSYSSVLTIRSNGSSVSVTGNPSRFNRLDNLFGFERLDDCVAVYNQILLSLDLPPFTKSTRVSFLQSADGTKAQSVSDGAIIRSLDWTRNWNVGQGNELAFLRGLASQTIGRGLLPHLYSNGYTVDWRSNKSQYQGRGSTYRYDKAYLKAQDLLTHRAKRLRYANQEDIDYYDRVIQYCQDHGIVREEQSKKAPWLKKHDTLAHYGRCDEADFLPYLNDIHSAIQRLEVQDMTYETIAEQLLEQGICKSTQAANSTESYYLKWLHGTDLDRSKSQYHVHRNRLLRLGIDISIPHDISRQSPQIKLGEVISVTPALMPHWYRQPSVRSLRAA
ncbi:MAG: phage/plasmid replication protein [Pseudomonadota bacterium]